MPIDRRRKRRRSTASFVPSGRTIALLFAALASVVGLYGLARESSLFAVQEVEVYGVPPSLARQIRGKVRPFEGRSLVSVDGDEVRRSILVLPDVRTVRVDRDFPNTLRVFAAREHAVAVLRSGKEAWLVAASSKVIRRVSLQQAPDLPRIWQPKSIAIVAGEQVAEPGLRPAIAVLAEMGRSRIDVRLEKAVASEGALTFVTRSGMELRLGDATQAALKLAVIEEVLPRVEAPPAGSIAYLDVSLPSRPVSGTAPIVRPERD